MSMSLQGNYNNKICIFGLGKTGISVYEFVKDSANVVCYDDSADHRQAFAEMFRGARIADLDDALWKECDKIILSPGVPPNHKVIVFAGGHNIPIISDIDLLYEFSKTSDFIAVTGTNGKSTTVALISHILQRNGVDYPAVGNIGVPALNAGQKKGYVLELSSFQLDIIRNFKSKISVLLNITPDHLNHHETMEAYIAAKKKIFDRMDSGALAIINIDCPHSKDIYRALEHSNITLIPISNTMTLGKSISISENKIYDNFFDQQSYILPFNNNLQGTHNQEKIAASFAVCRALGLGVEEILCTIETFRGLPHRMQYVGSTMGINFYNDSKATNGAAASKALSALTNIYWLAGGVPKKGGIEALEPYFSNTKKAYLFGEAKYLFASTLKDRVHFEICSDLEEAFNAAFNDAERDSEVQKNILLAPACASYDQFKNFEERGELFMKLSQSKLGE